MGINLDLLVDQIGTQLSSYDYTVHNLRLSHYLAEQARSDFKDLPFDEKVWEAMTAGDVLRQNWQRSDALALQAVSDIVATREQASGSTSQEDRESPNLDRHAFVIRSLKTPDELETLRSVYGPRLIVIAAYSPRAIRLKSLAEQIQDSRNSSDRDSWAHQPEELIARDEKEQETRGQDVSGTFHRADFFVRAWDREVMEEDLGRTFEILFGEPFRTPTIDEYCQFMAAGASLRSAEFGRQVGAAVATEAGSVIALGTNEVPKPGGGSFWDGEADGNREFEASDVDTNRKHFDELAEELSTAVDRKLEAALDDDPDISVGSSASVREAVGDALPGVLRQAGLKDLTEFGRAVHAEMNALMDAARRGISVQGATLYTTTFPCHNCARHIIGAGIQKVVFIEPYGKSRASELHRDAVLIEGLDDEDGDERVTFVPFVGVAPRRYLEMFDAAARERLGHQGRQDPEGRKQELNRKEAVPVFADSGLWQFRPELREYRAKELLALEHFNEHAVEQ